MKTRLENELEGKLKLAGTVHRAGDGPCLAGIHVRIGNGELRPVKYIECLCAKLHVK